MKRAVLWLLGLSLAAIVCLSLAIVATMVPGLLILLIIGGIFVAAVIITVIIGKVLQFAVEYFQREQ